MTRFSAVMVFAAGFATMLGAALSPARAQEAELEPWRFNATAYGWLTSISGSTTAKGQTFDVNAGFFDILRNSSSIAAFDGYLEAQQGQGRSTATWSGPISASPSRPHATAIRCPASRSAASPTFS